MPESSSCDPGSDPSHGLDSELRDLFRAPPIDPHGLIERVSPSRIEPGTVIDDLFVVERMLGRGGMGVVYLARHEILERPVAIKLCRRRATARQTQRLLREARAMAALTHPNVVVVHHVGTTQGQVYVVMEYVAGGTLRRWWSARARGWAEIVAAFVEAGRGLAAAHAKGFVHRDFKPDNVLVGDDGRVRVGDFGLVLGASQSVGTPPLITDHDHEHSVGTAQGAGTPRYMAPEQREGDAVGPAADQYSLCMSLHEALYGGFPGEPRCTRPRGLPRRIDEALQRGLCPEVGGRHPDMAALLRGLEPRRGRRVWGPALGLSAVASGLTWWGLRAGDEPCPRRDEPIGEVWNEARRARAIGAAGGGPAGATADTRRLLGEGFDAYAQRWAQTHALVCADDAPLTDALRRAALACLDESRAYFDQTVSSLESGGEDMGERTLVALHGLPRLVRCTEPEHLRARGLWARPLGSSSAVSELRQQLARVRALEGVGRVEPAAELLTETTRRAEALGHRASVAEARLLTGRLGAAQAWPPHQIIAALEGALLEAEAAGADRLRAEIGALLVYFVGVDQGHHAQALAWGQRTEAVIERLGSLGDEEAARLHDSLGRIDFERGELSSAQARLRRAEQLKAATLGDDHPSTAGTRLILGRALQRGGRYDEAEVVLAMAARGYHRTLGALHPISAQAQIARAELAEERGDDALAEARLLEVLDQWEAAYGPEHERLIVVLNGLGRVRSRSARHDEALAAYARARRLAERSFGFDHLHTAWALVNEAEGLRAAGASAAAIETYRRAISVMRGIPGHAAALEVEPRVGRAEAWLAQGDLDAARADLREVEVLCRSPGCEPAVAGRAAFARARVLAAQGEHQAARQTAHEALQRIPDERRTHRQLRRSIVAWLEEPSR